MDVIEIGMDSVLAELGTIGRNFKNPKRALDRIGNKAKSWARMNAPIGPTAADLKAVRLADQRRALASNIRTMRAAGHSAKAIKKAVRHFWRVARSYKRAGAKRRKPGATTRPKPGSLQNSIEYEIGQDKVTIRVPSNSPAGKYAWRIHNEKGVTWRKRGPGTVRKGSQADDKFIERAVEQVEHDGTIGEILEDEAMKR